MNATQVGKGVVVGGLLLAVLRCWRPIVLVSLVLLQMAINALGSSAPYAGGALALGVIAGVTLYIRKRVRARREATRAQILKAAAVEARSSAAQAFLPTNSRSWTDRRETPVRHSRPSSPHPTRSVSDLDIYG